MPRHWFGGTSTDMVVRKWGRFDATLLELGAGVKVTFWDAEEGGTRYTDLLVDGTPAQSVETDDDGYTPRLQGPDDIQTMWADLGDGSPRRLMVTTDGAIDLSTQLATKISTAEKGAVGGVATLDGTGRLVQHINAEQVSTGVLDQAQMPAYLQPAEIGAEIAGGVAASVGAAGATADVRFFTHTGWAGGPYDYEVIHVRTGGVPVPRLLEKRFADDYDALGTTGSSFVPPRENPVEMFAREGHSIIVNTEGWQTSGNVGEIIGCQIKDGVILHDFEASGSKQGTDTLGFKADGTAAIYSARNGDTAASVLADGVRDCFGFGPALVIDGQEEDLEANSQWGDWNSSPSARQILGVTADGELVIISMWGKSADYGIYGNEIAAVAKRHGCHQAIMLDGGGSTQSYIQGAYGHVSSDAGLQRPVPAWGCLRAQVTSVADTGWVDVPYATGHAHPVGDEVRRTQVRRKGDRLWTRGRVIKSGGGAFTAGAFVTVGTLPRWAQAAVPHASQITTTTGSGGQLSVTAGAPLALQVRPVTADAYVDIGGHTYTWF